MGTNEEQGKDLISADDIMGINNADNFAVKGATELMMSALGINKINEIYKKISGKPGYAFIEATLQSLEINYSFDENELTRIPAQGAFILISNHSFGGIEGLILLKEILKIRPDLKVTGNFLLHRIEPIKEYIFPVDPFDNSKNKKPAITSLKATIKHLEHGKPILIFPAGEVSTFNGGQGITDKKWSTVALKFIKKANVPVVPIYFQGNNSIWFHSLGLIHPLLRTAKLPSELLNKHNQLIKIRIGRPISVAEQAEFNNIERYGRYLRSKTYLLSTSLEVKKFYRPLFSFPSKIEDIAAPIEKELLKFEIENLPAENILFKQQNYTIYCAEAQAIPNVLCELGRLREITFRAIGEGTNLKSDIDEYDLYYNHLFIWDSAEERIAGAYRIGMGKEIMRRYGVKGFYLRSLFKIKKGLKPILNESLELGRSFIVKEYQKNPVSLFLLWKGILHFLVSNLEYRYLIGPVSISNRFSNISKTLIVNCIKQNFFDEQLASYIKPKNKFKVVPTNIDTEILSDYIKNFKQLDSILYDIETDNGKVPVLLKKYIDLNGKIIGFNIDPKFNDALDGLLILDLLNVPESTIRMLSREMDNRLLAKRFSKIDPMLLETEYDSIPQY
jgi:putative hemolysin